MSIIEKLSAISKEVGAVRKDQKNVSQKFNFRGIDQVVNATHKAFTDHGIVAIPRVLWEEWSETTSGGGKKQAWVKLKVEYTFYASVDDSVTAVVVSEATDFADKATAKASSVAYRTALLQVLHLPTDEPDPDSQYEERGEATKPAQKSNQTANTPPKAQPLTLQAVAGILGELDVPPEDVKTFVSIMDGKPSGLSECKPDQLEAVVAWAKANYAE